MMANPEVRAMIEANPEMGHALQDPEHLRQTMRMARDPRLRQEFARIHDRQMANVNAIPGGFNHLQRLHQQMEGPLRDAADRDPTQRPPARGGASTATAAAAASPSKDPAVTAAEDKENPFIVCLQPATPEHTPGRLSHIAPVRLWRRSCFGHRRRQQDRQAPGLHPTRGRHPRNQPRPVLGLLVATRLHRCLALVRARGARDRAAAAAAGLAVRPPCRLAGCLEWECQGWGCLEWECSRMRHKWRCVDLHEVVMPCTSSLKPPRRAASRTAHYHDGEQPGHGRDDAANV